MADDVVRSLGGAATNRGIWYQALWSVLQAANIRISTIRDDHSTSDIQLVLEPRDGDAWLERPGGRRVIQLKSRQNGYWSLKEVVEEVFPAMYRDIDLNDSLDVSYEFVTEAQRGDWAQAQNFFESLGRRLADGRSEDRFQQAYVQLKQTGRLHVGGAGSTFWANCTTERQLFDRIASHLAATVDGARTPCVDALRKTWLLLANFRFVGGVSERSIRRRVDSLLLEVVGRRERVESIRDSMVGWLIDRSTQNNARVTPAELFASQGLQHVLSLARESTLRERCWKMAARSAELRDYRADWDVRRGESTGELCPTSRTAFTAVSGDNGVGKSWRLYAEILGAEDRAVVLMDATGDAERDMQRAADAVWKSVLGHDGSISMENLARRRTDALEGHPKSPWLLIGLDQLTDVSEANALLRLPIEDWGVELLVACDRSVFPIFEGESRRHANRISVMCVDRFTPSERDEYLGRRIGEGWADVPVDVRELARSPLLAAMYCELHCEVNGWQPQNEYELVGRYWDRVRGLHIMFPLDEVGMHCLANTVLAGAPYPWSARQLDASGLDDAAIDRITKSGWLRRRDDYLFEVPHDRLLNYVVASSLVEQHRTHEIDDETVAGRLGGLLRGDSACSGVSLGYVPMDWFAIRSKADELAAVRVFRRLRDGLGYIERRGLHQDLLPTLATASIALLWDSLTEYGPRGEWSELWAVLEGLAKQPTSEIEGALLTLLNDDRPLAQRAALRLLARHPVAGALDRVWRIHVQMQAHPECYFPDDTPPAQRHASLIYEDSFDALRVCVLLDVAWLTNAIQRADTAVEPVSDLAYLVACLNDDGRTWHANKSTLFAKVPMQKRRALVRNIGVWRDLSQIEWLEQSVAVYEDLLGPSALLALARLDPSRAAAKLLDLPEPHLYGCRHWFLPRLHTTVPDGARAALQSYIRAASDPIRAAMVYQGNEHEMNAQTLSILSDMVSSRIGELLEAAESGAEQSELRAKTDSLFLPLELIASAVSPDSLAFLTSLRNAPFERRLADLLVNVIGPRREIVRDSLAREPAISILLRIGGSGYRQVVNSFLGASADCGRLDAIDAAMKDYDSETADKLRVISQSQELWNGDVPLLQLQAARALAAVGDARGLLEAAIQLGLKMPANLDDWTRTDMRSEDAVISGAMTMLSAGDTHQVIGALLALGAFKHEAAVDQCAAVLRDSDNEDVQLAAIIALGCMQHGASGTEALIARHLEAPRFRHAALVALSRIGTSTARRLLLESLDRRWHVSWATWLARFEDVRPDAMEHLAKWLRGVRPAAGDGNDDAQTFLREASEDVLGGVLGRLPMLVEWVREQAFAVEGAFWHVGSKYAAIRALGVVDPRAAWLAAHRVLRDARAHDRHMYPSLIHAFESEAARDLFLELVTEEKNAAVVSAMSAALSGADVAWLCGKFTHERASVRSGACLLSSSLAVTEGEVYERLFDAMADPSYEVSEKAEKQIAECRRSRVAIEITRMLGDETSELRQAWSLAEATLSVGPCGFENGAWPQWARTFLEHSFVRRHPPLRSWFLEQIERKRHDALSKAEQDSRSN